MPPRRSGLVQGKIVFKGEDTLTALKERYTEQTAEIDAMHASEFDVQYQESGGLKFALTEASSGLIRGHVLATMAGTKTSLVELAGSDSQAQEILTEIVKSGGSETTGAQKSMHIFLFLYNNSAAAAQLLPESEPAQIRRWILEILEAELKGILNASVLEPEDIERIAKGNDSLQRLFQLGLAEAKQQWSRLGSAEDRTEYITKRISHEANKGYNRRYENASTPLQKLMDLSTQLSTWFYGMSRGAPLYPDLDWSKMTRTEQIAAAYTDYKYAQSGGNPTRLEKSEAGISGMISQIAATLYEAYRPLGRANTRNDFESWLFHEHGDEIRGFLIGGGLSQPDAIDLLKRLVSYLDDEVMVFV